MATIRIDATLIPSSVLSAWASSPIVKILPYERGKVQFVCRVGDTAGKQPDRYVEMATTFLTPFADDNMPADGWTVSGSGIVGAIRYWQTRDNVISISDGVAGTIKIAGLGPGSIFATTLLKADGEAFDSGQILALPDDPEAYSTVVVARADFSVVARHVAFCSARKNTDSATGILENVWFLPEEEQVAVVAADGFRLAYAEIRPATHSIRPAAIGMPARWLTKFERLVPKENGSITLTVWKNGWRMSSGSVSLFSIRQPRHGSMFVGFGEKDTKAAEGMTRLAQKEFNRPTTEASAWTVDARSLREAIGAVDTGLGGAPAAGLVFRHDGGFRPGSEASLFIVGAPDISNKPGVPAALPVAALQHYAVRATANAGIASTARTVIDPALILPILRLFGQGETATLNLLDRFGTPLALSGSAKVPARYLVMPLYMKWIERVAVSQ